MIGRGEIQLLNYTLDDVSSINLSLHFTQLLRLLRGYMNMVLKQCCSGGMETLAVVDSKLPGWSSMHTTPTSTMSSEQSAKLFLCFYNTDAYGVLVGNFSLPPPSQRKMKASKIQNQHDVPDLKTYSSSPAPTNCSTAEVLFVTLFLFFLKTSGHAQI